MRRVLVATYGRALKKLNIARKHLAHDRLVLVCDSGDKDLPLVRENEEERGGEFVHIEVDPYDFDACLAACSEALRGLSPAAVKVNISCGPKTLVGAMLFAAFHRGVEVYHCDEDKATGKELVIRLPTLMGFELRRRFSEEDWKVIRHLRRGRRKVAIAEGSGLGPGPLDRALTRLEREGLLRQRRRGGRVVVEPTSIGRFFAREAPGGDGGRKGRGR